MFLSVPEVSGMAQRRYKSQNKSCKDVPNCMMPFKGVCRASDIRVLQTAAMYVSKALAHCKPGILRNRIRATSTCKTRAAERPIAYVTPKISRAIVRLSCFFSV